MQYKFFLSCKKAVPVNAFQTMTTSQTTNLLQITKAHFDRVCNNRTALCSENAVACNWEFKSCRDRNMAPVCWKLCEVFWRRPMAMDARLTVLFLKFVSPVRLTCSKTCAGVSIHFLGSSHKWIKSDVFHLMATWHVASATFQDVQWLAHSFEDFFSYNQMAQMCFRGWRFWKGYRMPAPVARFCSGSEILSRRCCAGLAKLNWNCLCLEVVCVAVWVTSKKGFSENLAFCGQEPQLSGWTCVAFHSCRPAWLFSSKTSREDFRENGSRENTNGGNGVAIQLVQ